MLLFCLPFARVMNNSETCLASLACRRILVLFGVQDSVAKSNTLSQRHDLLKDFKKRSDAIDGPKGAETPRYTRKRVTAALNKEVLQREFEAELSVLGEAEEEEEEDDDEGSGEDDEMAKDLEDFLDEEAEQQPARAAKKKRKNWSAKNKRKVVKKTLYFNNPDGTRWKRVELITDYNEVTAYLRAKDKEKASRSDLFNVNHLVKKCLRATATTALWLSQFLSATC